MYHLDSQQRGTYFCFKCGRDHYFDKEIGKKHLRYGRETREMWEDMEFLKDLKKNYEQIKQENGYVSFGFLQKASGLPKEVFEKKLLKYESKKFKYQSPKMGLPWDGDRPYGFAGGMRVFELKFYY